MSKQPQGNNPKWELAKLLWRAGKWGGACPCSEFDWGDTGTRATRIRNIYFDRVQGIMAQLDGSNTTLLIDAHSVAFKRKGP